MGLRLIIALMTNARLVQFTVKFANGWDIACGYAQHASKKDSQMSDSNYNKCRICNCYYSSNGKLTLCVDCVCKHIIKEQKEPCIRDLNGEYILATPSLAIARYGTDMADAIQERDKTIQLIKEGLKSRGI